MKNENKIKKELLEKFFSPEQAYNLMNKLGISKEEKDQLFKELVFTENNKIFYNRVLSEQEKNSLTVEAFGHLLHLLTIGSLNRALFEKIINICTNIKIILRKSVDKNMIEKLIEVVVFTSPSEISIREIIEIINNSNFQFDVNKPMEFH